MPVRPEIDQVWLNGQFMPMRSAMIPPNASALHYAGSVFEGIRAYSAGVLFLREHMERLLRSAAAYRLNILGDVTVERLCDATLELLARNRLREAYIRPLIFRGVNPNTNSGLKVRPSGVINNIVIMTEQWEQYVRTDETGAASALVTNWQRTKAGMFPGTVKGGALYAIGQLVSMEAERAGCSEGLFIGLNEQTATCVLDGSGQNLAMVKNGQLITPDPKRWNILGGLTLNFFLHEAVGEDRTAWVYQDIKLDDLLTADEVLLFGTASEVVPVGLIRVQYTSHLREYVIGNGRPGQVAKKFRGVFSRLINGHGDYHGFLTPHQSVEASAQ